MSFRLPWNNRQLIYTRRKSSFKMIHCGIIFQLSKKNSKMMLQCRFHSDLEVHVGRKRIAQFSRCLILGALDYRGNKLHFVVCNIPLLFASGRRACIATAGNVSGIDVAEVDRSKSRPNYVRCLHYWGQASLIRDQFSLCSSQSLAKFLVKLHRWTKISHQ